MPLCSDEALHQGQQVVGTAFYAQSFVLLPLAKDLWAFDPHVAARLNPYLAAWLDVLRPGQGAKFYAPGTDDPDLQEVYVATQKAAGWHALREVTPLERCCLRPASVWAICVHGQRDRCCAKYGFGTWRSLSRAFPDDEILQVSHLGGDRFAATCLHLPSGDMLGWLRPDNAVSLVTACRHGTPPKGHWRGNIFRSPLDAVIRSVLADAMPQGTSIIDLRPSAMEGEPSQVTGQVRTTMTPLDYSKTGSWRFEVDLHYIDVAVRPSCAHTSNTLLRRYPQPSLVCLEEEVTVV
jgi:Sucrase/ferredoxin-like